MTNESVLKISELRAIANHLFDHMESTGRTTVNVDADYYWQVADDDAFDLTSQPNEIVVGQLTDDLEELRRMVQEGPDSTIGYGFVWLGFLLRAVGATSPE